MNDISFDPRRIALEPDELAGRVIAITGPTSGIGRALALECARRGAEVLLLGRNVKKLEVVYDEIVALRRSDGSAVAEPLIAPLDLEKAVAGDYDAIATAIEQRWGRLDGLVHNAGLLGILSPIEHFDVPTWVKVMHVNVTAIFALTQVLLPALRASSDASVICTSSGVGRRGRAYWGAYSVSKFALEGLVNSVDPGRCRTPMRRQAYPSENPDTLPAPEAIVGPFVALLGPRSRGVSGRAFSAQ